MSKIFLRTLVAGGCLVPFAHTVFAQSPSFADLLAKAESQAASGHRWAPPGDNMTETVAGMMGLISTATPSELSELSALLEADATHQPTAPQPPSSDVAETQSGATGSDQPNPQSAPQPSTDAPASVATASPPPTSTPQANTPQANTPQANTPEANTPKSSTAQPGTPQTNTAQSNPEPAAAPAPAAVPPAATPTAPTDTKTAATKPNMVAAAQTNAVQVAKPNIALVPLPNATLPTVTTPIVTTPTVTPPAGTTPAGTTPAVAATVPASPERMAASPAPAAAATSSGGRAAELFARGQEAERLGDVSGARRFYASAVQHGNAVAARNLGRLYDPAYLKQMALGGIDPDPALARHWYERAVAMGDPVAGPLLEALALR